MLAESAISASAQTWRKSFLLAGAADDKAWLADLACAAQSLHRCCRVGMGFDVPTNSSMSIILSSIQASVDTAKPVPTLRISNRHHRVYGLPRHLHIMRPHNVD